MLSGGNAEAGREGGACNSQEGIRWVEGKGTRSHTRTQAYAYIHTQARALPPSVPLSRAHSLYPFTLLMPLKSILHIPLRSSQSARLVARIHVRVRVRACVSPRIGLSPICFSCPAKCRRQIGLGLGVERACRREGRRQNRVLPSSPLHQSVGPKPPKWGKYRRGENNKLTSEALEPCAFSASRPCEATVGTPLTTDCR